jgi:hypothetical protein
MRRSLGRPRAVQLELFRPPPQTPTWQTLPPEVKRRTAILLARMLHEHLAGRVGANGAEEATNE